MTVCKVKFGNFEFELEAKSERDLFETIAHTQEVFDHDCGKCGSSDVKLMVRVDGDDNKYYEMKCNKCNAKLSFGCHKKGETLFPRRQDGEGKWLPDNGWLKWDSEKKVNY